MSTSNNNIHSLLSSEKESFKSLTLRRLFEEDASRAQRFSLENDNIFFDFSKNHITPQTLKYLCQHAEECHLPNAIQRLLAGENVNNTEDRPALHSALRFQGAPSTDKENAITAVHQQMSSFVEKVHTGQWLGFNNEPIETVINIGIGGSDLGPRMVTQALSGYHQSLDVRFVANIDGADLQDSLQDVNAATTLFIIASKSFTTMETLQNGLSARQWMLDNGCSKDDLDKHFVAISTNIKAATEFGIADNNIFPMWDWVGGRYSLWSAIGLPIALAIGMKNFHALLSGAHGMDEHFGSAPLSKNMPVIAGLLTYWYCQYWDCSTHAVLPYAQRLNRLPAYLQQLDMESLGKSVTREGQSINYNTGAIIWGTEGTNGQHSFHQLLHQGTHLIPADFIMCEQSMSELEHQHQLLQACCISQSQALLKGKTLADAEKELEAQGLSEEEIKFLAPHKVIPGNRPSNTIILKALTPESLGALIAFYEHKVYTCSVLWNINPFDQWGVELGKQLGVPIQQALTGGNLPNEWDGSTIQLIQKLKN